MNSKFFDYITTGLLFLIPVILFFQDLIIQYTPSAALLIVTIILAFLSQYAANQRVKDAVEAVIHWKVMDYLTTILFAFGPVLLAYQTPVMQQIPPVYIPLTALLFGALSQFITNVRVRAASQADSTSIPVNETAPSSQDPTVELEEDDDQGC